MPSGSGSFGPVRTTGRPLIKDGRQVIRSSPYRYWITQDRARTNMGGLPVVGRGCPEPCDCVCDRCYYALAKTTPQWLKVSLSGWSPVSRTTPLPGNFAEPVNVVSVAAGSSFTWPGGTPGSSGYSPPPIAIAGDLNGDYELAPDRNTVGTNGKAGRIATDICVWKKTWLCDAPITMLVPDPDQPPANFAAGGTISYIPSNPGTVELTAFLGGIFVAGDPIRPEHDPYWNARTSTAWVLYWTLPQFPPFNGIDVFGNPTFYPAVIGVATAEVCSFRFTINSSASDAGSATLPSTAASGSQVSTGSDGCVTFAANQCEADSNGLLQLKSRNDGNIGYFWGINDQVVPRYRIDASATQTLQVAHMPFDAVLGGDNGFINWGSFYSFDGFFGADNSHYGQDAYPPLILYETGSATITPQMDWPDDGHIVPSIVGCPESSNGSGSSSPSGSSGSTASSGSSGGGSSGHSSAGSSGSSSGGSANSSGSAGGSSDARSSTGGPGGSGGPGDGGSGTGGGGSGDSGTGSSGGTSGGTDSGSTGSDSGGSVDCICIQFGTSGSFTATSTGNIQFYANDILVAFGDNSGSWIVDWTDTTTSATTTYSVDTSLAAGTLGPSVIAGRTYNYEASGTAHFAGPDDPAVDADGNGAVAGSDRNWTCVGFIQVSLVGKMCFASAPSGSGASGSGCTGCGTFAFDTGVRVEWNAGGTKDAVRYSDVAVICVDGVESILFDADSDDWVGMIAATDTIAQSWTDDTNPNSSQTFSLPRNYILFDNTAGTTMSNSLLTTAKTWTDGSHSYTYPDGATIIGTAGLVGRGWMDTAGFRIRRWSDPVSVDLLRSFGWVDANNFLRFRMFHVPGGNGFANVRSVTCTSTPTRDGCNACFQLGTTGSFVSPSSGRLQFVVNDSTFGYPDNSGNFTITFAGHTYTVPAAASGGVRGPYVTAGVSYPYTTTGFAGIGGAGFFCDADGNLQADLSDPSAPEVWPTFAGTGICASSAFGSLVTIVHCDDSGSDGSSGSEAGPTCIQFGSSGSYTPTANGSIQFYFNDLIGAFGDNSGTFTVAWTDVATGTTTNYSVDAASLSGSPGPTVVAGREYSYVTTGEVVYDGTNTTGPDGSSTAPDDPSNPWVCPGLAEVSLVGKFAPSSSDGCCDAVVVDATDATGDYVVMTMGRGGGSVWTAPGANHIRPDPIDPTLMRLDLALIPGTYWSAPLGCPTSAVWTQHGGGAPATLNSITCIS